MKESLLQEHINDNDEYVKEEAADEDNRMGKLGQRDIIK